MRKLLLLLPLLFFCAPTSHAACSGSSPTWTAASTSSTDVQACFSAALQCGDTIIIPAGASTWTSTVSLSPPTGCAANQGITVVGQTVCSAGCAAGSEGIGLAFTGDTSTTCNAGTNTCITLAKTGGSATTVTTNSCANTAFCTWSNITFLITVSSSNGQFSISGTFGQVAFRVHHVHFINSAGGVPIFPLTSSGLIDHYLLDDSAATDGNGIVIGGDFPSKGYANWNSTTLSTFGTDKYVIVEDSQMNFANGNGDGFYDAFYGANVTIRHNQISQSSGGGGHGTDSGGFRSTLNAEVYNNTISCGHAGSVMNTRGGTLLFFNNVVNNGMGSCAGIDLQYYRVSNIVSGEVNTFGVAGAGLDWTPISATPTSTNTLNAPDWQTAHTYAANAAIGPTSNNSGGFNYQNQGGSCVSGVSRPTFSATIPSTTSDGTCTWTNVAGVITPSANVGSSDGFCILNPDTLATGNATCNALSGGDTAGRFFDSNGGVYPLRDQPGLVHNQCVYGNYSWNNSGTGLASPLMGTDPATSSYIQSGRDFFNTTMPPGACGQSAYAHFTYPDPLQGTPTAATPSCSPGAGTYGSTQSVTCSDSSAGAIMCYTTNGTTPATNGTTGCTTGTLYSGAISISVTTTLKVIAGGTGYVDGSVLSNTYVINIATIPAPANGLFLSAT